MGVNYALSETGPSAYTQGNFSCDGGTQGTNSIQLAAGDSVTCTVNNNDNGPTLALDKTVVNDNGGNAVENDFVLSATPTTGPVITDAGGDVPATAAFANRVYTLSETTLTGYSASAWVCTGTGVSQSGSTVTLSLGAAGVCAITNNDVAPTLALNKTVVNDNGGNAVENDFVLSATP
jgi:hypothetical protein